MTKKLESGDTVEWNTPQGTTRGTVEKKITSRMKIKRHKVAASKNNPEYLVKSSGSGKTAAQSGGIKEGYGVNV